MVVIVERSAAKRRRDGKVDESHQRHDAPRTVLNQIGEVLKRRRFRFIDGLDAFLRAQEGDHEQNQTEHGPDGHRYLPAVRTVVADGELGNKRQREATDVEHLRDVDGDETKRVEPRAFVQIGGHDAAERGIRHVVHRVERHQQCVGDARVGDEHRQAPTFRRGVGEHHHDGPRPQRSKEPTDENAPNACWCDPPAHP